MAIVNHYQNLSIYRMVLDRLPFVVDDSLLIFDLPITVVDTINKTLTVSGNYTDAMWKGQTQTVLQTAATLYVTAFNFTTPNTIITYASLIAPQANVSNTLHVEGNFNEQLISRYIYQMMVQLQPCFQISPETDIGDESKYSTVQKIIIAELVSWYILFRQAMINSQGNSLNSATPVPPTRYISSAKAGEVSTNWSYVKMSDTGLASIDAKSMMAAFKENAVCLANSLGCHVEVCPDGAINCSCQLKEIVTNPFRVASKLPNCGSKKGYF